MKVKVNSKTDSRIYGQLPKSGVPVVELLDVVLKPQGAANIVYEKGIQFLEAKTLSLLVDSFLVGQCSPGAMESLIDI